MPRRRGVWAAKFRFAERGPVPELVGIDLQAWQGKAQHFAGDICAIGEMLAALRKHGPSLVYVHGGAKQAFHYLIGFADAIRPAASGGLLQVECGNAMFRDSHALLPIVHDGEPASLLEWISEFVVRYGMHVTIGTAAIAQLREFGYSLPHIPEHLDDRLRPWYFGGRVQAFETGSLGSGFHLFDMNSAYAAAMLEVHPWGNDVLEPNPPAELPGSGVWLAEVDAVATGAFPWRSGDTGKVQFPADGKTWRFHITSYEAHAARMLGLLRVQKVHRLLVFQRNVQFSKYVSNHWQGRQDAQAKGDSQSDAFHKAFLNALYGRFGINPRKFGECSIFPKPRMPARESGEWELLCGAPDPREEIDLWVWERMLTAEERAEKYLNVATSASIAGCVRARMLQAIAQCGPVYCDTDCVITRNPFLGKKGSGLGEWKTQRVDDLHIAGPKMYSALVDGERKVVAKGVRLKHSEMMEIIGGAVVEHVSQFPTYSLRDRGGKRITYLRRRVKATGVDTGNRKR